MTKKVKQLLSNIFICSAIVVSLGYVVAKFAHFGHVEYTDNAQICRHISPINSRVQGYIKEIRFEDFQHVKKGDTLVIIDDTDHLLQVAIAEAQYQTTKTSILTVGAGVSTSTNNVAVTDASIAESKANLDNATRNYQRFEQLYQQGACTLQERDNMLTTYQSAQARHEGLLHAKKSSQLVVNEQSHRLSQTEASLNVAEASLNIAKQQLSYTVIVAPVDGITSRKKISVGQLINPGQTLLSLVHDNEVWVVANYRETQLKNIAIGNEVEIEVDALPNKTIIGHVERVSNATGAAFSMVPQDNATGNFVKVEQRVPVRISLEGNDINLLNNLQAGLNVECEVKY